MLFLELAVHLIVQECNIVAVMLRSTLDMFFDLGAYGVCSRNKNPRNLIAMNLGFYSCLSRQATGFQKLPTGLVQGLKMSLSIIKCREKNEGVRVKTW